MPGQWQGGMDGKEDLGTRGGGVAGVREETETT